MTSWGPHVDFSTNSIKDFVVRTMPRQPPCGTRPMDARDRGNWIETEGAISSFFLKSGGSIGTFRCSIHVVQIERAPLEEYVAGAISDGVPCGLTYNTTTHATHAYVQGIRNVDREIRLTSPYIRTANKWQQIRRFYELVGATDHRRQLLGGHARS